jgi:hypothetical protein
MAIFVAGMIFSPLAASSYPDNDYLDVQKAIIDIDKNIIKDIVFKTRGDIPKDGSDKNFGYGVVTLINNSSLNVIATTSHPKLGIVDSELQNNDPTNPVFHNHYVILGNNTICGANPAVQDLSFTSPGKVIIDGNKAILKDLPASAQGQFNSSVTITPGTNVLIVASFLLESHFSQQGQLQAVCVVDIKPVEPQDKRTIIIGQKDKDYYNEQPRNDDYYNEQPRNDDYYNEQPRNDDYYNEQPRNDDYYNEQPRNDEYNRDDGYNNENTYDNSYDNSYGYEDYEYNSYHPY